MSSLEVITAPNLFLPGIEHGFFTRLGGVSEGIYESLNCGLGSSDARENVMENRARAARHMGVSQDRLLSPYQVHSADALYVDAPFPGAAPEADGLVTMADNLALCALSADCGQILFADPEARVVGACHAGWKGALSGIIDETVLKMVEKGASKRNIHAALGPCLSQANYEVGEEFVAGFLDVDAGNARFFAQGETAEKRQFDLPAYIEMRLNRLNLGSVWIANICTYADESRFFSYRRTTHKREKDYGRLLSAIKLC